MLSKGCQHHIIDIRRHVDSEEMMAEVQWLWMYSICQLEQHVSIIC